MQRRGSSGQPVKDRPKVSEAPTLQEQVSALTRELKEAREQQTAMADVLGVISGSPTDLKLVFDTILANATRLCEGNLASLWRYDGECLVGAAQYNASTAFVEHYMRTKLKPGPTGPARLAALERRTVHIADITAEPGFTPIVLQYEQARTVLAVPLLRENDLVGVIAIWRREVRPFTDKQVELVKNFAAQAVIAIENTRLLNELRKRTDDLSESLEQQTATSEVLKVISSTRGELQPVFQAILENATRICEAKFGTLYRTEGDAVRCVAMHGAPKAFAEERRRVPVIRPAPTTTLVRALATKQPVQIADVRDEPQYPDTPSGYTGGTLAKLAGARTLLAVPMLKDDELIGAIINYRQEVRPFTDKQIELVKSFAAQAVIAIENARLLNELRQRTDDLTESLEQQTATSEVLKVISSSPGDLEPVFESMLQNSVRICEAGFGQMFLCEGDNVRLVAAVGVPTALIEFDKRRGSFQPSPGGGLDRVMRTKQVTHIADLTSENASYPPAKLGGARSYIAVPMVKENQLIGAIAIYRQEVQPFTDKQIELVQNFAAQAVIAIENTRLLNELRQRTDDLSESLDRQTATSEVLKVISSSPGKLDPVFQTMLANATRICEAAFGSMLLLENSGFRRVALHNAPPLFLEFHKKTPVIPTGTVHDLNLLLETKRPVRIEDAVGTADSPIVKYGGARTLVIVPMLKESEVVGAIGIYRQEVRPFTDKQIELVTNFAAQAVIAIENTRLLSELRESLQQQTATSEVLKVISSSPGELEPVFQAMLENAVRICEAKIGTLYLREADTYRAVAATSDAPAAYVEARKREPHLKPPPDGPLGRVAITKQVVHMADIRELQSYVDRHPVIVDSVELGKFRTALAVPMLKDDELIGAITIMRQEVRPFSEKQIDLVQNFAAQAVIAIENTRLLNELRESLQQQTATADVLKVISSSPGELKPVFNAMLENAVRICDAKFGNLMLRDGDGFLVGATHGAHPAYVEYLRSEPVFSQNTGLNYLVSKKEHYHLLDLAAARTSGDKLREATINLAGARTLIGVPMLKDDKVIGAIIIYRQEVRPFTEKQIELVKNFAAQAVIAIENTRLLSELRESLQQQTATADVLKVISSSPGTLDPVFSTMLAKATELCEANYGTLWLREGDGYRAVTMHGDLPPVWIEQWRSGAIYRPGPDRPMARAAEARGPIQVADMRTDPSYLQGDALPVAGVEIAGIRTLLLVPMFKESEHVGLIAIYRTEVLPFTEKQIDLVKNFAAQAVIAIENTRLLNDLRKSLQQQTATADVLKVISRSTFDLQTVLDTLVESATRLCEADHAWLFKREGERLHWAASFGYRGDVHQRLIEFFKTREVLVDRGSVTGRAALEARTIHVPDVSKDTEYTYGDAQRIGGYRAGLGVPLLREGDVIGVIFINKVAPGPFSEKQIELVTTFADQAVIAIENVRLLTETREALENLRTTQDRLVQTQKLASLGQLTAGIAHEIKNPLNFVNNFSGVSAELINELQDVLKRVSVDEKTRAEIEDLTETLQGNLDKVVQHGKRADAIVKNMLLHSREGSGEHRVVDINALVEESLNLAYHGARAEKQDFNITMERSLDPAAGQADVFPQDITRVLLNLISNGFYAATKRKAAAGDGYEPTLVASTRSLGDRVEIRVRDNGTGIPPEVKEKIFNPFFTTKPAGEGTGLGLSISHDVIVKQHGGSIEVETQPGEFTEIRVTLPRVAALLS